MDAQRGDGAHPVGQLQRGDAVAQSAQRGRVAVGTGAVVLRVARRVSASIGQRVQPGGDLQVGDVGHSDLVLHLDGGNVVGVAQAHLHNADAVVAVVVVFR